jgi:tRNA threonylcarbamoyladenosine biosynthesis protein TsaE
MKIISRSPEETIRVGKNLAKKLKVGSCVALIGDLGSGKTVFTKGIAEGLGVKDPRYGNSPTFVIVKEYKGKMPLYHFDLYRLDTSTAVDLEGYKEYFYDDGVTVVEWAEKIRTVLPKGSVEVRLKVTGENERRIEIKP